MVGCGIRYVRYDARDGRSGYEIACSDKLERCESKAKDLCPDGFETVSSSRRSKRDMQMLPVIAHHDLEYILKVECNGPATDGASEHTTPSSPPNLH
jgi:hypothetical protein